MKKIGIITLYGETNYGNRLQNYAVQEFFKSLNCNCETIVITNEKDHISKFKKVAKNLAYQYVKKDNDVIRQKNFRKFTKGKINTRYIKRYDELVSINQEYDFFVVGSDQVWNPCFGDYDSLYETMFLMFVQPEKKMCISPSFGVSKIPEEWRERFRKGLLSFPNINVREIEAISLVKDLCGKEATLMIDPTMLIDEESWNSILSVPKQTDYIFSYFLGDCVYDLNSICVNNNCSIIDINNKENGNYYRYTPTDFLGLIKNASLVCTDSFHACVFSILFDVPFIVYKRLDNNSNMQTRFQTLFQLFDIKYDFENPQIIKVDSIVKERVLYSKREEAKNYYMQYIK